MWKDKSAIFQVMVQTNQIERATTLFRQLKKSYNAYLTIEMYEAIVNIHLQKYEESGNRALLEKAIGFFNEIGKYNDVKKSGKIYAMLCRGLLHNCSFEDLELAQRIFSEPKENHKQVVNALKSQFPGIDFESNECEISENSVQSMPYRPRSLLEDMINDSVMENAPPATLNRFVGLLEANGLKSNKFKNNVDLDLLKNAKAILDGHKLNFDDSNFPELKTMPSVGVRGLTSGLISFDEQVQLKLNESGNSLSIYDLFHLQNKLEEQCFNITFERMEQKSTFSAQAGKESEDIGITTNFKIHPKLKDFAFDWFTKLQSHIESARKISSGSLNDDTVVKNVASILDNFGISSSQNSGQLKSLLPLFSLISPEKFAMITVIETIKSFQTMEDKYLNNDAENDDIFASTDELNTTHSVFAVTAVLCLRIGEQIVKQHNINKMQAYRAKLKNSEDDLSQDQLNVVDKWERRTLAKGSHFDYVVDKLHANYNVPLVKDTILLNHDTDMQELFLNLDKEVLIKLGAFALDGLIRSATVNVPAVDDEEGTVASAFFPSYKTDNIRRFSVIRVHPYLNSIVMDSNVMNPMDVESLPMIIPPKPWISWKSGGYLTSRSPVMRFNKLAGEQISYVKEASLTNRLPMVFDALNVLGKTAWVINKPILDVGIKLWNEGKHIAGFPEYIAKSLKFNDTVPQQEDLTELQEKRLRKDNYLFDKRKRETFSLRCSLNYTLEVANRFRNFTMYFPHNIDFRGRAYPIPAYLNHMNGDFNRGLLKFKQKKKLEEHGWKWLKVHLANVYGHNKVSFDDRCKFTEDHMADINAIVEDPFNNKWWLEADDPWQCLATSMEIVEAIKSGDPASFMSNFPVHQDGSCNGLQHYAAIGGDEKGAELVNLKPQEKPADVYTLCADNVRTLVEKDASKPNSSKQEIAMFMKDKINRKLVKQTVMTLVYGVTLSGARRQIESRISETKYDIPENISTYKCAEYITKILFESIGTLFSSANQMQEWLRVASKIISKSTHVDLLLKKDYITPRQASDFRDSVATSKMDFVTFKLEKSKGMKKKVKDFYSSVTWTAPNGLTCVQPYKTIPQKSVSTVLSNFSIENPNAFPKVNSRKHVTAFSPNFIHSLDSTHMMLTAIECNKQNLSFAAVHDSYWTLASDIPEMNSILRKCFIKLHAVDVANKLREEFVERYKYNLTLDENTCEFTNLVLPPLPKKGTFKIDEVSESKYFFH